MDSLARITEFRFHKKHMRSNARENPRKVIPSRFAFYFDNEKVFLTYQSLVIEGPKSLVCRYSNRSHDRNSLPKTVIVKFQLKFQSYPWGQKLKGHIQKRYIDPEKGDELCMNLPISDRLCRYFGTYVMVADPRVEAPDRWEEYTHYKNMHQIAEGRETFIIQIFEEIRGADLYNFICNDAPPELLQNDARNNVVQCTQILCDIAEGLDQMHCQGIYHSDLKPENVMLYKGESGLIRATIIDFDFAAKITDDRIKRGTPRYLSPEYIQAYREHIDLPSLGKYGCEFDIWAFGAMIWTLFFASGDKLYFTSYSTEHLKSPSMTSKVIQNMLQKEDYDTKLLLRRTAKPSIPMPAGVKTQVIDLTRSCLAWSPTDRPSTKMIIERLTQLKRALGAHNKGWRGTIPSGKSAKRHDVAI